MGGEKFLFIKEFSIGVDEEDNVCLLSLLCWSGGMRGGAGLWAGCGAGGGGRFLDWWVLAAHRVLVVV